MLSLICYCDTCQHYGVDRAFPGFRAGRPEDKNNYEKVMINWEINNDKIKTNKQTGDITPRWIHYSDEKMGKFRQVMKVSSILSISEQKLG